MQQRFYKYQGTGNDFILIDNRNGSRRLENDTIRHLCDRKFGIGSDGLILLESDADSDFYMNFYNPDASRSFCGNGSRCAVSFARYLGISGDQGRFRAIDGVHEFAADDNSVRIHMKDVSGAEDADAGLILDTGSPHYIVFVEDPEKIDLISEAKKIRYSDRFREKGINVNFVAESGNGIRMRTYERGVEDETLSCGTGVTAAAIAFASKKPGQSVIPVITRGGHLEVRLQASDNQFTNIWLCGPAKFVFEGTIEL